MDKEDPVIIEETENPEKSEKSEKPEKTEKTEKKKKAGKTDKSEKTEKSEKTGNTPAENGKESGEAGADKESEDALAALKKENEELKDRLLRTLAEYDNYRKRTSREKEAAWRSAQTELINRLLPAIDDFDRAGGVPADSEGYVRGIVMSAGKLSEILASMGVKAFGEPGDEFDPSRYSAVMHDEDPEQGENVVSAVFSKGYMFGDAVIRPAVVKVTN